MLDDLYNIIFAFTHTDKWHLIKLPPLSSSTATSSITSFVLAATFSGTSKAFSIIFDKINSPTGYYVSGYYKTSGGSAFGMFISYISNSGVVNWSFKPNSNGHKIDYLSLDSYLGTDYLWGCGQTNYLATSSLDPLYMRMNGNNAINADPLLKSM